MNIVEGNPHAVLEPPGRAGNAFTDSNKTTSITKSESSGRVWNIEMSSAANNPAANRSAAGTRCNNADVKFHNANMEAIRTTMETSCNSICVQAMTEPGY